MSVHRRSAYSVEKLLRQVHGGLVLKRLSHVGGRPLDIPATVNVSLHNDPSTPGTYLRLSGPLGTRDVGLPSQLKPTLHAHTPAISTAPNAPVGGPSKVGNTLVLSCSDPSLANHGSQWGLAAATVANAVQGVSVGFSLGIKLVGVGYRAALENNTAVDNSDPSDHSSVLVLRLGYPRPIRIVMPPGISCLVSSPTDIVLTGPDKQTLGELAARVRRLRPPEPYNGKGVFVGDEQVVRKEVKKK